jgi:ankyrin repeat protein
VDCKGERGNTGLIAAARDGHFECVNMMMEAKADVDCKNYDDDTALTTAFRANHFNILMLLLDHDRGVTQIINLRVLHMPLLSIIQHSSFPLPLLSVQTFLIDSISPPVLMVLLHRCEQGI